MEQGKIFSRKVVSLLALFFAGIAVLAIIYFRHPDGKLHLIFCDVGQGDAILAITPAGDQILIDGGPDNSVLSCLGKNLPFYDRNLELVVLTHPQADHLTGLVSVFKNYQVEKVLKTAAVNNTAEFEAFNQALTAEKAQVSEAIAGLKIGFGEKIQARIIWPPVLSGPISDLNETSVVLRLDFGNFCALLTGDATNSAWFQLISQGSLSNCFLLKVAHHGSKNATDELFLSTLSPKIAVISSGKNNRYGHPHEEVIKLLSQKWIKVLRTDLQGSIEIVTDGKSVQIN